jgi:hypothetical protein
VLHTSTQKLIIKLCELTEAGHIAWKQGDGETCRFETEGYVVEVQGQPATLRLLHSDGRELERADEPDLAAQSWPGGDGTFAAHITLLAARAHRIARGAELAISRILSSLSAPPKAPPFDFLASASQTTAEPAEPAPPPAPHTVPGPPPEPIVSDTALDRVFAVDRTPPRTIEQAAPETDLEPVIIESEATAIVGDPQMVDEVVAEVVEEHIEPPPPEAAVAEPTPVLIEAETVAIVAEPAEPPRIEEPHPQEPAPKPPVQRPRIRRPQNTFGAITSFARPRDPSEATAAPRTLSPKPFSTSPLFFGVNQMSREPVRAEPEPPPVPPPAAKPIPADPPVAEKKPEPAVAGPDIYKPWS